MGWDGFNPHRYRSTDATLGKHLGMFVDRKELTGKDGGPIEIMTPDQRKARIEELEQKRNAPLDAEIVNSQ